MTWDKDNPPAEFWGSDMQFGWGLYFVSHPLRHLWAAAAVLTVILSLGTFTFARADLPLGLLCFAGFLTLVFGLLHVLSQVFRHCHMFYYLFHHNSLRVRVDFAGPITLLKVLLRRPTKGTIRFTQDDVKALSVSQRPEYFPHVNKSVPAIRLTFTLLYGEAYHHSQLLDAEPSPEHIANLRDFQALFDRLESALGPDRIETATSLKDSRIALQRALQVKEAS